MVEHDRKAKTCVVGSASLETAFDLTTAMCATAVAEASRRRARGTLVVIAWSMMALVTGHEALAQERCLPVSERTGEVGCWIMTSEPLGRLSESAVFWHLDTYPNRAAADAQKGPRGTVIEALGRVWLFTIGAAGWRPAGGVRVAEIGPLLVKPGEKRTQPGT